MFLQSVKSLCRQPTLASITLPKTQLRNPLVLLIRYEMDPFSDTSGGSRPRVEEERSLQAQRKCLVPQTVTEISTLVTQVLSLPLKGRPGHVHEHLQHYIKPVHGLQPGSSDCHSGGTGLWHTSKGQPQFFMAPHSIYYPGAKAGMSKGQDKVLRGLNSVPSPLVLQGWSKCTELLPLFILFCSSDDIFFTAASFQGKTKGFAIQQQSPSFSCGCKSVVRRKKKSQSMQVILLISAT